MQCFNQIQTPIGLLHFCIQNTLNEQDFSNLKILSEQCDDYFPFTDTNLPYILCYDTSHTKLIGFLSLFADDAEHNERTENVPSKSCEVTALVAPSFRQNGIFTIMLQQIKQLFPNTCLYGTLPDEFKHTALTPVPYYRELLLQYDFSTLSHTETQNTTHPICDALEFYFSENDSCFMAYLNDTDNTHALLQNILIQNNCMDKILISNLLNEPVCVCNLDYEPSFTNIYGVYTEPALRHLGIGTHFIQNLIYEYFNDSELSSNGNTPLILNVRDTNIPALRLYEKCGFHPVETLTYYKL